MADTRCSRATDVLFDGFNFSTSGKISFQNDIDEIVGPDIGFRFLCLTFMKTE